MSDNAIRVGDLVAVVRPAPCCQRTDTLGTIFTVTEVHARFGACTNCGIYRPEGTVVAKDENNYNVHIWRLLRIPPLWELDEAERKEEHV